MSDAELSPNISYRELDVEFLTKQARIWLEAVLGHRFDQETSLADLLADGEILDKVALVVRTLLQRNEDWEPTSPKSLLPEASFYGKHSGKYLPYANVDGFLKICQKLGLTGVDLFSPPDVVEKKDIRSVCLCIRTLSKKARARQLRVPNFDYVSHTVPMPTEFVDGLRKSLKKASSPSVSKGSENKETPRQTQVQSSPLRFGSTGDAGASVESNAFASSDSSEDTAKESGSVCNATDFGENGTGDNKNADFLKGSRSSSLFDDDTPPSEDSSLETQQNVGHLPMKRSDSSDPNMDSSSETSLNQKIPGKNLGQKQLSPSVGYSEKADIKQKAESDRSVSLSAEEQADRDKKDSLDCGKIKKRAWVPFVTAVVALIGAVLVIRAREPQSYEVKKGDTLSQISKRVGKSNWEELMRLNPGIINPDLIYPSERLVLRT